MLGEQKVTRRSLKGERLNTKIPLRLRGTHLTGPLLSSLPGLQAVPGVQPQGYDLCPSQAAGKSLVCFPSGPEGL